MSNIVANIKIRRSCIAIHTCSFMDKSEYLAVRVALLPGNSGSEPVLGTISRWDLYIPVLCRPQASLWCPLISFCLVSPLGKQAYAESSRGSVLRSGWLNLPPPCLYSSPALYIHCWTSDSCPTSCLCLVHTVPPPLMA